MHINRPERLAPNYNRVGFDFLSENDKAIYWFNHFTIKTPNKQLTYDENLLQEMTVATLISEIRKFIANINKAVNITITIRNNYNTYTRMLTKHDILLIQRLDCIAVLYTDKMIKDYISDVIYRIGNEYSFNPKLDRIDNDISVYLDAIHRASTSSVDDTEDISKVIYPELYTNMYLFCKLNYVKKCIITSKPKLTFIQWLLGKLKSH